MLGIMFFLMQKHLPSRAGCTWSRLCEEASLARRTYAPKVAYADSEAVALLESASRISGCPLSDVLCDFGEAITPDLIILHAKLIRPEWNTLELLLNAEQVIHAAVRRSNPAAAPPLLQCHQTMENEVQLVYCSRRQMCALAKGIIRGVARYFGDTVEVVEDACMLEGDHFCAFRVTVQGCRVPASFQATAVFDPHGANVTPRPTAPPDESEADAGKEEEPKGLDGPEYVAHYRILRTLGQGGMGTVYAAEDTLLGREVALKIAAPEMASHGTFRQRFLREAQSMASIHSDKIVSIYQVGQHRGCPFIAMQLLSGANLEAWRLAHPRISFEDVIRIGREIALALASIHEKGIVHRDIKPTNVWLEAPWDCVKLLDFGLVRDTRTTAKLTQLGTVLGTPQYMAPEQACGAEVDGRSDLYSLGVVLYEMVTNRLPFPSDNLLQMLATIATETAPPVSRWTPSVPRALDALIMQLLSREMDTRPASASTVAATLLEIAWAAEPARLQRPCKP